MSLEITFWDVQHGCATLIRTPNDKIIVQDLGIGSYEENKEFSPLMHLFEKYSIKSLDALIISHPHKDHIEDIGVLHEYLLDNKMVLSRPQNIDEDMIRENVMEKDEQLFDYYFQIDRRFSNPIPLEETVLCPDNNGGVDIKVFGNDECSFSNINDYSLVTVISYCGVKIILSGDNENASWGKLLEQEDFISEINGSDLFLASHHGRESGFCPDLFKYFQPKITIISDGKYCDSSATERYSNISTGWKVFSRTSKEGKTRKCITTRNDGVIVAKVGIDSNDNKPFLNITIS